jgi:hypothetical protein
MDLSRLPLATFNHAALLALRASELPPVSRTATSLLVGLKRLLDA